VTPKVPSSLIYTDDYIEKILRGTRTIAIIGASANWVRPSSFVMKYLQGKGYQVLPVNPARAGEEILGSKCYANIAEIPDQIDMVDIFRSSESVGPVIDEILPIVVEKNIRVIWMQLGVRNDSAAMRAEAVGLQVVMDRCPKIEYGRLFGELSWSGVNSGVISSKRRRIG
tara:strand:+ start:486 stop:995 length:510 start_codon:yes stop_codon:yes gene_type:complete